MQCLYTNSMQNGVHLLLRPLYVDHEMSLLQSASNENPTQSPIVEGHQVQGWDNYSELIRGPQFKYPRSKSVLYTLYSVKKCRRHSIMCQKVS